ncbi:hypothetical protein BDU57DRAFT_539327 [Ampelomyces quisqualis]|uniref:EKC/KEOPS complex subunit GON7 n=1 Tax=Ampelomyces quisqualis TaxID=50730 RepID=A0A6A5QT54_AMPQU|nr:hypothetical protein BDU57DRAFT_539327 [Ampelomyces quisqualis]
MAVGYGLWAVGCELWAMGYGLWAMGRGMRAGGAGGGARRLLRFTFLHPLLLPTRSLPTQTMPSLTAQYASDTAPHKPFTRTLPALPDPPAARERVAYLAALQPALRALQADLNAFLTQRMEHDRAAGASKADDAKAEETYGEEVVDED